MRVDLLDILACPRCGGGIGLIDGRSDTEGMVPAGTLHCSSCDQTYPLRDGVPRFVTGSNYSESFGYQWNTFLREQLDCFNGTTLSRDRFFAETEWTAEWLAGKRILDVGCGAGRFLDVASRYAETVVGLDSSDAIDAARRNLADRRNVDLVQASVYELPFRPDVFDGCYCVGMIQHTPDPQQAVSALGPMLKPAGRIAVTAYRRNRWTRLHSKYLLRPLTTHINSRVLLSLIRFSMPFWFVVTEVLFRIPMAGKIFQFLIPIANYVDQPALSWSQRYQWAIMDTFDALSPAFDQPQTRGEVEAALSRGGIVEVRESDRRGLSLVGVKARVGRPTSR